MQTLTGIIRMVIEVTISSPALSQASTLLPFSERPQVKCGLLDQHIWQVRAELAAVALLNAKAGHIGSTWAALTDVYQWCVLRQPLGAHGGAEHRWKPRGAPTHTRRKFLEAITAEDDTVPGGVRVTVRETRPLPLFLCGTRHLSQDAALPITILFNALYPGDSPSPAPRDLFASGLKPG